MMMKTVDEWKALLRDRIREAMKARCSNAVTVLREALAAIDNAEAVPLEGKLTATDHYLGGTVAGGAASEVPRLALSPESVNAIIRHEIEQRRDAATEYSRLGLDERAEILMSQVAVLETLAT